MKPSIESITLELVGGVEVCMHIEEYDPAADGEDGEPHMVWMAETFNVYGDSEDYGVAEPWMLQAAGLTISS